MSAPASLPLKTPVVRESLDRKAASQLRDAILTGSLAPGTKLTEVAIASQLGLSRGTIRAALQRLASEGLIVQHIYSSWEVVQLSSTDAWELYTLRSGMEGLAGRLAAESMTPDKKAKIKEAFDNLVEAADSGSPPRLADADLNLHRTIVELSGNARLLQHYRQVELQIRLYIASVNGLLPHPRVVAAEHQPIIDALLAEDAQKAEKALLEHSIFYGKKLVELLEHDKDREDQPLLSHNP